ncbi:DUF3977 family protein [Streptococcus sp. S784/96/1]|uniref:DUF3977 family protein n=1 Tax=Streptococcus sp. S784/96/1 TaxID=2653499 RepID=UPI001387252F|nr:DUF3977 family protein [Streptococcus sp. S784/96/1]
MEKFIEIGFGNRWFIRTEFEKDDGSEWEVKGISGKIIPKSYYLRLWFGKMVFILDSKEGFKKQTKSCTALKVILGIKSAV